MHSCLGCGHEAVSADADYCVNCGRPIRQPCPYDGCSEMIPLGADGVPTARCVCPKKRSFNYSQQDNRLYRDDEPHGDRPSLTYPGSPEVLLPCIPPWSCDGANPARTWSVSSKRRLPLLGPTGTDVRPKIIDPPEKPPTNFRIGSVLFGAGKVLYALGPTVGAYWPGAALKPLSLGTPIPPENWRMQVVAGMLYVVFESSVRIVDLTHWTTGATIQGTFIDQSSLGGNWVGISELQGQILVVTSDGAGNITGSVTVGERAGGKYIGAVSAGDRLYVAFSSGLVVCLSAGREGELEATTFLSPEGNRSFEAQYSSWTSKGLLLLGIGAQGYEAQITSAEGYRGTIRLRARSIVSHPVVIGERLYVMNAGDSAVDVYDLSLNSHVGTQNLPTNCSIRWACGVDSRGVHILALALMGAGGLNGQISLLDPVNGVMRQLALFGPRAEVDVVFAEGQPVVATSTDHENLIRIYELSDA